MGHLLKERSRNPGTREASAHIALCIEGGGLRGAVTGGMACAIEELGLLHCFDSVFASSVGSLTGAYLVSGEARKHRDFFACMAGWDDFVDLSTSALLAGRALDLELLAQQFSPTGPFPLKTDRLVASPLHPLVTKAGWHRAGSASHIRDLSDPGAWTPALCDSMRIPGVCGWPHGELRRAAWDPAPHEAIPFRTPLEAGATHLLILRSGKSGASPGLPQGTERAFRAIVSINRWLMAGVGMLSYRDQEAAVDQASRSRVEQVKSPVSCSPLTADPVDVMEADRRGEEAFLAWWEGIDRG